MKQGTGEWSEVLYKKEACGKGIIKKEKKQNPLTSRGTHVKEITPDY